MKGCGWDARRRNRNIGTEKSGKGKDNRLKVPDPWVLDDFYYERIENPICIPFPVHDKQLMLIVEEPKKPYVYTCTPQDIEAVLKSIPIQDLDPIDIIVLRQASRKERILNSVWGRFLSYSEIGKDSGAAIHLNSQIVDVSYRQRKSMSTEEALEFERLIADGPRTTSDSRYHYQFMSFEASRNTQLFRTLPHEVGHSVDLDLKVEQPSGDDIDRWQRLFRLYYTRPSREREDFAHRYATEFYERQRASGEFPFEAIHDPPALKRMGLDPEWFLAPH